MAKKRLEDMDFNEAVDALAGDAILQLIHGDKWRSIVFTICQGMAIWSDAQAKKKAKSHG